MDTHLPGRLGWLREEDPLSAVKGLQRQVCPGHCNPPAHDGGDPFAK